jgi:hypothetical protein
MKTRSATTSSKPSPLRPRRSSRSDAKRPASGIKTLDVKGVSDENNHRRTTPIWELPEILLYQIAQYGAPPTERASFICHKIATLSKASYHSILVDESKSVGLWDLVLTGDYGVVKSKEEPRRSCKRLKRSPADQVKDAHKRVIDNTELAYYYMWELSSSSAKNSLSRSKLVGILNEYGPHLLMNKTVSTGGTFLVEVCRCRNVSQSTILQCVQELVDQRGALVDVATHESSNSTLTALCTASVRGMPKVVEYLLSQGASTDIPCSARFRLHTNPRKSLRCTDATPVEFAKSMLAEEKKEGATSQDLKDLTRCLLVLERHSQLEASS